MTQLRIKDFDIGSARFVNLGIASWLLVSVFAWRHSEPQFLVTMLVGVVVAIVAPFEVGSPLVRKINTAAGAVLVVTAFALPHRSALTVWHNVVFGLALIAISFFGPPHGIVPPRPPAADDAYEGTGLG